MVHIMTWITDPNVRYTLSEIAKAVNSNFIKDDMPIKKAVAFGLAIKYGAKENDMVKCSDMVNIIGENASFVRLGKDFDDLSNHSSQKKSSYLNNKLGIIHNTLNCNRWANSKKRTI